MFKCDRVQRVSNGVNFITQFSSNLLTEIDINHTFQLSLSITKSRF